MNKDIIDSARRLLDLKKNRRTSNPEYEMMARMLAPAFAEEILRRHMQDCLKEGICPDCMNDLSLRGLKQGRVNHIICAECEAEFLMLVSFFVERISK